jgi:hypothetical protein
VTWKFQGQDIEVAVQKPQLEQKDLGTAAGPMNQNQSGTPFKQASFSGSETDLPGQSITLHTFLPDLGPLSTKKERGPV